MSRSHTLRGLHVIATLIVVAGGAAAAQVATPLVKPREPTIDCRNALFGGTITEVTKSSISIQWGKDEKPKKFFVSETLASGQVPMKPREMQIPRQRVGPGGYYVPPSFMYRLTDVKVGDLVAIRYAHLGEENICDHICIQKRPGGMVPPLPEEAEKLWNPAAILKARLSPSDYSKVIEGSSYIPYHEEMNAYWDLEDKGIPYPEKFGELRRFPVAPMPRLKTLTTPNISP